MRTPNLRTRERVHIERARRAAVVGWAFAFLALLALLAQTLNARAARDRVDVLTGVGVICVRVTDP